MKMDLQSLRINENNDYKIIVVADDPEIINSLSILIEKSGYNFTGITDSKEAINKIKNEHFDLMILDFIMDSFNGNQIVEEIRKFNKDLYILLLVGNKNLTPTLDTIKKLDIQGFCEKSDSFDQLLLLIESGINSIKQTKEIKNINNKLSNMYDKLEQAYLESIETLRYTVEAKDTYTIGHSNRVSAYSVLIGKYLGLSEEELRNLDIGGLFHDIGKIGVPDTILRKEIKLTDCEYSEIKNHPLIGAHILSNATIFKEIVPIVEHHHEKYDGSGYPSQLKGEEIPYLARITSVADAFDAMTSKRKYRDSLPIDTVISEFETCKGFQFDPNITDTFLYILKNHYDEIEKIQEEYS
jgi:putative nucleotidyltransferase with HDIG domain